MSKTAEEIGLIVGGIAAAVAAPFLLPSDVVAMQALMSLGVAAAMTGVGLALRPNTTVTGTPNKETFSGGDAPRRAIYGQFQTAGVLTYASFPPYQNQTQDAQYLHLIYTLAAHEISSFDALVIDGTTYNFGTDLIWNESGNGYWTIFPGSVLWYNDFYWQHIFFEFDFGRPNTLSTQPFPQLAAADSSWTSACVQENCAKVHVVLRADQAWPALFPSGQIPNIQFLVTGKKIVDTRITTAWQPSSAYVKYDYIVDGNGVVWVQLNTSGTSGPTEPNFTVGSFPATVTDGSCSWYSVAGTKTFQVSQGLDSLPQGHIVNNRLVNDAWVPGVSTLKYGIIEAPLGYLQMSTTVSGTSGASEPAFATTLGGATTDGTQGWVCLGRSWNAINPSNSALVVNDYLQDTDYGMSAAPSSVDDSSVIAAANVCEEQALIIWNSDNSVVYENLYSTDGVFDFSTERGNMLDSLCQAMAGWVVPPGDVWHVFAGSYQTPTVSLGDDDMRDSIKGDFRLSRRDVANSVKGRFVPAFLPSNPAAQSSMTLLPAVWQSQSFPAYQANSLAGKPDYLNSEDGGQIIWLDLQLDFCTSLWQAQRLAKIALMRTRFQQTMTLPCKLSAFQLEAGDTFYWTHVRWGISDGVFEAQQWALVMDSKGSGSSNDDNSPTLGVDIVARQVDPSIYEFQGPTSASDFGEYSPYGITGVMTGVE